jgi:tricorn protease
VSIDTRTVREIAVSAPMEVDFAQEKMQVARQAWQIMNLNFYDPKMHGVDWKAVWTKIAPRALGAKTPDDLRRILSLMIGELNASHTGVSGGRFGGTSVGRLGAKFDRAVYEKGGILKVTSVLHDGPAQQAGIKPGDTILSLDGEPIDGDVDLYRLLDRKVGRRVVLSVKSPGQQDERDVPVRPVDVSTEKTLQYRAWTDANRKYVEKASNGRLGYVHIADMGNSALTRLNADLDAEAATREGVVVDIRANTGGFVSPYVLDVLARRGYLTISRRGAVDAPGRIYVGQRALDLPTVLVVNRQSISDAENFTEGYRALKLGKVVGEPTAGGVIFTSEATLIDGTSLRVPFSKVTNREGKNLEGEGRPVDVHSRRKMGEASAGKDSQLDAAVKALLGDIDKAKK